MFTGLIEVLGTVQHLQSVNAGVDLVIEAPSLAGEFQPGDSVAVNGVCLTVVERDEVRCRFQVGPETLRVTNLGQLQPGDVVNLERSLRVGDRLGGHFVQGHVDGVGCITRSQRDGDWEYVWFSCPRALTSQMVSKGSIAVDGISLTVVDVSDEGFRVALIPFTLEHTTLGRKGVGAPVNLETDLLAKYVARCLQGKELPPS